MQTGEPKPQRRDLMFQMGWKNDEVPRLSNPLYSKPIQIGWATTEHVDVGLQNAKNTCFVNATIQVNIELFFLTLRFVCSYV